MSHHDYELSTNRDRYNKCFGARLEVGESPEKNISLESRVRLLEHKVIQQSESITYVILAIFVVQFLIVVALFLGPHR